MCLTSIARLSYVQSETLNTNTNEFHTGALCTDCNCSALVKAVVLQVRDLVVITMTTEAAVEGDDHVKFL